MTAPKINVAIVPGNGSGDITKDCNYYAWLRDQLSTRFSGRAVSVHLKNMPDPVRASQSKWLPFMESQLHCDERSIIVGHSSGAAAAMRYAETHKVGGIVLVGAYTSDMGDANERASGYFNRPWLWDDTKANCGFIIQFASRDDPFLPWDEQQQVARGLSAELHAFDDRGHFQDEEQPELLEVVEQRIRAALSGASSS